MKQHGMALVVALVITLIIGIIAVAVGKTALQNQQDAAGEVGTLASYTLAPSAMDNGGHLVTVEFDGILPDLFREGQGIVAQGTLKNATTVEAFEVLAKHDENYMPPEVTKALKESGRLPEGGEATPWAPR